MWCAHRGVGDGEDAPLHRALPPLPHLPQPEEEGVRYVLPFKLQCDPSCGVRRRLTRHSSSSGSLSSRSQTPCFPAAGACCSPPAYSASPAQTHAYFRDGFWSKKLLLQTHATGTNTENALCTHTGGLYKKITYGECSAAPPQRTLQSTTACSTCTGTYSSRLDSRKAEGRQKGEIRGKGVKHLTQASDECYLTVFECLKAVFTGASLHAVECVTDEFWRCVVGGSERSAAKPTHTLAPSMPQHCCCRKQAAAGRPECEERCSDYRSVLQAMPLLQVGSDFVFKSNRQWAAWISVPPSGPVGGRT